MNLKDSLVLDLIGSFLCVSIPSVAQYYFICITCLVCFLTSMWTLDFVYYKPICYEHSCVSFSVNKYFNFSWYTYLRPKLLGYVAARYLTFQEAEKLFYQSACTILHSYQQDMKVPIFPHPHQLLVLPL